jgi:hypothetical protein
MISVSETPLSSSSNRHFTMPMPGFRILEARVSSEILLDWQIFWRKLVGRNWKLGFFVWAQREQREQMAQGRLAT